jgi:hypothetical protein
VWYRASLSSEQVAAGLVGIIQRLFLEAMADAGDARGSCLFTTNDETGGAASDETHTALFFSPASITLVPHVIAQYGGQPSPAPERAFASLLVGDDRDWDLLPRSTH